MQAGSAHGVARRPGNAALLPRDYGQTCCASLKIQTVRRVKHTFIVITLRSVLRAIRAWWELTTASDRLSVEAFIRRGVPSPGLSPQRSHHRST